MMEKVIFEGDVVKRVSDSQVVGRLEKSKDMCIDVILNNGCHQYAYYGTIDANGNFFNYCNDTLSCGKTCFEKGDDLSCRYNRNGTAKAGYYVDTSSTESVY